MIEDILLLLLSLSTLAFLWALNDYVTCLGLLKKFNAKKQETPPSQNNADEKLHALESEVGSLKQKLLEFHELKIERKRHLTEFNRLNNKISAIAAKTRQLS